MTISVAGAFAGCTIATAGPKNVQSWGVATSPAGSEADLYTTGGWFHGELLAVSADGVLIETKKGITFVQYSALRFMRPVEMKGVKTHKAVPSDSTIATWLPLVRFPADVTPAQLAVLLSAHGQSAPMVVR